MSVKAVYYVKELCILRSLNRKIGCASAAKDHYIDLVFPISSFADRNNRNTGSPDRKRCRISSCENSCKLHVGSSCNCEFYAFSNVTVTKDTNSDTH